MMYFAYTELTPELWQRWLRRLAREQRLGLWIVTVSNPYQISVVEASLQCHTCRCPIKVQHDSQDTALATFEFIPC